MNSSGKCLICGCAIEQLETKPLSCSRCDTSYHQECWDYAGGCAVFGCDPNRWNPKTFSTDESWQAFLTKVQWWSDVFKMQWFCLLLLAIGLTGGLVVIPSSFILTRHIRWFARTMPSIVTFFPVFPLFFIAGLMGLVAFWIPATMTRRSLERELGNKLLLPSDLPERALAEAEVTFLGRASKAVMNMLTWAANCGLALLFYSYISEHFLPFYMPRYGFPTLFFFLLALTRFVLIPRFRASVVSRLFHLNSMKSRIASSTMGK